MCAVNLGNDIRGVESAQLPSVLFAREDTLGEGFVNGAALKTEL